MTYRVIEHRTRAMVTLVLTRALHQDFGTGLKATGAAA